MPCALWSDYPELDRSNCKGTPEELKAASARVVRFFRKVGRPLYAQAKGAALTRSNFSRSASVVSGRASTSAARVPFRTRPAPYLPTRTRTRSPCRTYSPASILPPARP